jgi:hypothetical protein
VVCGMWEGVVCVLVCVFFVDIDLLVL